MELFKRFKAKSNESVFCSSTINKNMQKEIFTNIIWEKRKKK